MDSKELRVNGERLKITLEKMAEIGTTPAGGVHRLALSDEDKQARDLFVKWLREIDLRVTVDEMGNIFGWRPGKDNDLPPVMSGSHIDSQPKGGRFDGILGVMGALEAFRTIRENQVETQRPLVIVDWTNEEGSRFPPAMVGSGVWAGKMDKDFAYSRTDFHGKKFGEELERIGYKGTQPAKKWPLHAYWELHIEQGPILEKMGKKIGVPEGIVGIGWYDVQVDGKANQVGPTPMKGRNDALCAAAEMILKVEEMPGKMGGNMVATVGEIHNFPNSRNIIPGQVKFTVDVRSWDDQMVAMAREELRNDFERVAEKRGCSMRFQEIWKVEHAPFDQSLMKKILEIAGQMGYASHSLVSGAGHDASYMSKVAPTAMIFVPSIGGRSHVEVENTGWEDCEAGANVLLHCILQSAL
ncbi:MAG: Zn-dependent hydrolase [Deltaproteobacteria bacterium]|nr:Zn-dependent hydrolase [Deltaproteobacteria bacterium]